MILYLGTYPHSQSDLIFKNGGSIREFNIKNKFETSFGHCYEWTWLPSIAALVASSLLPLNNFIFNFIWFLKDLILENEVFFHVKLDRKSTRLNSSHSGESRMPSSA